MNEKKDFLFEVESDPNEIRAMDMKVTNLTKKSMDIDRYLEMCSYYRKVRTFFASIGILMVFWFLLFENSVLYLSVAIGTFLFAMIVISYIIGRMTPKLNMGERISYCLSRTASTIENGTLDKKYIEYLYWEAIRKEERIYLLRGNFLEVDITKYQNFWKTLKSLSLKINHAMSQDNLEQIDTEMIHELGYSVYKQENRLFDLLKDLTDSYSQELRFPTIDDRLKPIAASKYTQFAFCEIALLLALIGTHKFFFPDEQILGYGFFTLSAAILYVVFKR